MGMSPAEHAEEVERWRRDRLDRLTGPEGWLSLVGLWWLSVGDNRVGSDPANEVVLPEHRSPPVVGTIRAGDGVATFTPEAGSPLQHGGRPVTDSLRLDDDSGGDPTILSLGALSFFVVRRGGVLAVRVRDADAPARREFRGIGHYPVDIRWRIEARFEPYDPPRATLVPTVLGTEETYPTPGALVFEVNGASHRLDVFLEPPGEDLFVVFGDQTNRSETFGGGRYVYARPPGADGIVVLDFNKAYNPPCVFTPHATCPLPLPQNRLPIRVEAGEKRYEGSTLSPDRPML